jgi:hypothetical protein
VREDLLVPPLRARVAPLQTPRATRGWLCGRGWMGTCSAAPWVAAPWRTPPTTPDVSLQMFPNIKKADIKTDGFSVVAENSSYSLPSRIYIDLELIRTLIEKIETKIIYKFITKMTTMQLSDYDLRQKKYTIEELIKNIDHLSIKTLLYTQKLTPEFCLKYIINVPKSTEEEYITEEDIIRIQKFNENVFD